MKVWLEVDREGVQIWESATGEPLAGFIGDEEWALNEAYETAADYGWHVTHEQRSLYDDDDE